MDCREFQLAWVSDNHDERRAAERHAAGCPHCAETVCADRALLDAVTQWKQSASGPPERIGRRIAEALVEEDLIKADPVRTAAGRASWRSSARWAWVAAAAVVILGVAVLIQRPWLEAEGDSLADAVRQVEQAQHDYARAIAGLEFQANEVLARADDSALESKVAALLLNYRDRLTHLDSVIAEVQAFLDEHPGHAQGHTVLLAAYEEKDELLREIVSLSLGETS
jgi:hypothetical protein